MTASTPLPANDPLMVAWKEYEGTEDYKNNRHWAKCEEYVEGSMWAVFMAGWLAAKSHNAPQGFDRTESINAGELREYGDD